MKKFIFTVLMIACFSAQASGELAKMRSKLNSISSCAHIAENASFSTNESDNEQYTKIAYDLGGYAHKTYMSYHKLMLKMSSLSEGNEADRAIEFAQLYAIQAAKIETKLNILAKGNYTLEATAKNAKKLFSDSNCQFIHDAT